MNITIDNTEYRFEHEHPYLRIVRTSDSETRVVRNGNAAPGAVPALFEKPQDPEEIAGLDELLALRQGPRGLTFP
jgi:hypothetical protein